MSSQMILVAMLAARVLVYLVVGQLLQGHWRAAEYSGVRVRFGAPWVD